MMPFFESLLCLSLVVVTAQAAAIPISSSSQACSDLWTKYPKQVVYQSSVNFTYTVTHYWNAAHGQLVPSCVFYPTGAADVSYAVQVLIKYPDVPWAAKSGGHNPNKNWSSVKEGVLISFRPFMQSTTLNADGTANVGPGSRWSEAVTALKPYNKAVVGGRIGDVGVGGYTLGGGLSFLSSQYGMACDLVSEFEVVLADGTITTANDSNNTDLFYALKGGGNQFAIVTNFKMKTVPIGQVWGGIKVYTLDKALAITNATHDFAANYPDVKAAVIPTFNSLIWGLADILVVFYFYDGPTVPSGVFDKFNAIHALIDDTKVQSYADLLGANDAADIYGFNYLIRAQTIPSIAGDDGRNLLKYQFQSFLDYAKNTQPLNLDLMIYSFAMQPLPTAVQSASLNSGSLNTFAFDVADGDRIWMEYDISWVNPFDETNAFAYADHFTQDIVAYAKTTYPGAVSTHQTNAADQYSPLFLNDGMFDQATSLFYKPTVYQRLKGIQKARDPNGFFSTRTGGAKFV